MLISALASEPLPIATTLERPNSTMAKYSGEEKRSANVASGCGQRDHHDRATEGRRRAPQTSVQPSALAGWPLRPMV